MRVTLRKKTQLSNTEIKELLARANEPLVYMIKSIERNDIAHPTVQATCRPIKHPTSDERKWFQEKQIGLIRSSLKDFYLVDSSSNQDISGFPATYFKASFRVQNKAGMQFVCLGNNWTVFYYDIAFTFGLSG